MIADVAHGKAREAGEGIILLAKLSGRPIIPLCICSFRGTMFWKRRGTRRQFRSRSGDPPSCVAIPTWVDADADDVQLEEKRVELTRQLNRATDRAYAALEKAK